MTTSKITGIGAPKPLQSQRGVTLVIAMIMLALLTLFVVALSNMTNLNLRAMGNMQARSEAVEAAQQAIEQVATTDFPKSPVAVSVPVDVNGDGTTDYTVAVAVPTCLNSVPIKPDELDPGSPDDQPCFASSTSGGTAGSGTSGVSLCSNTQWELRATVTDNTGSNAQMTLHQGIGRRVATGDVTC